MKGLVILHLCGLGSELALLAIFFFKKRNISEMITSTLLCTHLLLSKKSQGNLSNVKCQNNNK